MLATLVVEDEMRVLRKHRATEFVQSLRMRTPSGNQDSLQEEIYIEVGFSPRDPVDGPFLNRLSRLQLLRAGRRTRELPKWIASGPWIDTRELPPAMSSDLLDAYKAYAGTATAHDDARKSVLVALDHAIKTSYSLEALIEKWPLAEQMRAKLGATALPAVIPTDDFASRIASAMFVVPPGAVAVEEA